MKTKKNPNQLTVRLEPKVMSKFDEAWPTYRSLELTTSSAAAAEAIKFWSDLVVQNDRTVMESLISSVIQQLQTDTTWAWKALSKVELSHWDNLFSQRVQHFFNEKKSINENFIPFLVARMLHLANSGKQIRLIIDSGSTLKSTFDELVPELDKVRMELKSLGHQQIQIVTNNYPGAASYESSANRPDHPVGPGERISDLVPCHLVPGRAIQDYAAIMGSEAEQYVEALAGQTTDTYTIGLVVGNWMLLHGSRPVALARGEGHPEFKEVVLKSANEIFFITPLCKLFLADKDQELRDVVKEIDDSLRKLDRRGGGRPYKPVEIPDKMFSSKSAKVVTTMRENSDSIALLHSELVNRQLGKPLGSYDNFRYVSIEEIPHLIYAHDKASLEPFGEQLKIEFPHKETREPWFREQYFHCRRPPKSTHEGVVSEP